MAAIPSQTVDDTTVEAPMGQVLTWRIAQQKAAVSTARDDLREHTRQRDALRAALLAEQQRLSQRREDLSSARAHRDATHTRVSSLAATARLWRALEAAVQRDTLALATREAEAHTLDALTPALIDAVAAAQLGLERLETHQHTLAARDHTQRLRREQQRVDDAVAVLDRAVPHISDLDAGRGGGSS